MPVFHQGLNQEALDCSGTLMFPLVWRTILSFLPQTTALQLDSMFGSPQLHWYMRTLYQEDVLSFSSWRKPVMINLMCLIDYYTKYKVPCPELNDYVQYAVDQGFTEMVRYFLNPSNIFYDLFGKPICQYDVPRLDVACCKNYAVIVKLVLNKFSYRAAWRALLLNQSSKVLNVVMKRGHLDILKQIVPLVIGSVSIQGLEAGIRHQRADVVLYALKKINVPSLPEHLFLEAAKVGNLQIFQALWAYNSALDPQGPFVTEQVLHTAFVHGHTSVLRICLPHFPGYVPHPSHLVEACKHGSVLSLQSLPRSVVFPPECLPAAIKSKNVELVRLLFHKFPDVTTKNKNISKSLLSEAVNTGSSDMIIIVFDLGAFEVVPDDLVTRMARKNCRCALKYFHKLNFQVYQKSTLLEAATMCHSELIHDILETKTVPFYDSLYQEVCNALYLSSETSAVKTQAFDIVNSYAPRKALGNSMQENHNTLLS